MLVSRLSPPPPPFPYTTLFRSRARRTAGDDHPVGGAAHRRDLVRRAMPDSHHVNVSWHPRNVAGRSARSPGRYVLPPLRQGAPIVQHAPLARPAALHRRGDALIAAVQAAAPRGQKTTFALPVVGKPVRSVVSNHRAPLSGTDS